MRTISGLLIGSRANEQHTAFSVSALETFTWLSRSWDSSTVCLRLGGSVVVYSVSSLASLLWWRRHAFLRHRSDFSNALIAFIAILQAGSGQAGWKGNAV